jgi:hypothetical protein
VHRKWKYPKPGNESASAPDRPATRVEQSPQT